MIKIFREINHGNRHCVAGTGRMGWDRPCDTVQACHQNTQNDETIVCCTFSRVTQTSRRVVLTIGWLQVYWKHCSLKMWGHRWRKKTPCLTKVLVAAQEEVLEADHYNFHLWGGAPVHVALLDHEVAGDLLLDGDRLHAQLYADHHRLLHLRHNSLEGDFNIYDIVAITSLCLHRVINLFKVIVYCTDVSLGMVSRGIINDSMEFETLPVGQGNILVRGPSQSVRRGISDGLRGVPFY